MLRLPHAERFQLTMPSLVVTTTIAAPPEVCFDLARDIEAHCECCSFAGERAVPPGRTSGRLEVGDVATFEGRHFGIRQRLTVRITAMDPPRLFTDEQVIGAFAWLRHTHAFEAGRDGGTVMRDRIDRRSPFGPIGIVADRIAIEPHVRRFLVKRQRALKAVAERGA